MLASPSVEETLIRLPHQTTLIESTNVDRRIQGIHHNIFRFEEGKLVQLLDINKAVDYR